MIFFSKIKWFLRPIWNLTPNGGKKWIQKNIIEKSNEGKHILVEEDQLYPVFNGAIEHLKSIDNYVFGEYLEFGVYNGTSMSIMFNALRNNKIENIRLFGFDSFEGLPADADKEDDAVWKPGQFKCSYKQTLKSLKKRKVDLNKIELVKGFYSDTLTKNLISKFKLNKVSIIMIDCDMYSSTRDALNFCLPLIKDKCIIVFDDWLPQLSTNDLGEKKAFDEFLHNNHHIKASLINEYSYKNSEQGKAFLVENVA